MKKILALVVALCLAPIGAQAWWQSVAQQSVGAAPAAYVGPGDVDSGAVLFYSCARTLNIANASTSTNLCDLVANASPTVVICTLRGTTTGKVDLTLCADGVTVPATVCGALPGGVCNVSKAYNQVAPGTNDVTNATAASQPKLTFSALGGLPGMTCTNGAGSTLTTTGTITQNAPYSILAVSTRTPSSATEGGIFGESGGGSTTFEYPTVANSVSYRAGVSLNTVTASDAAFHSLIAVAPSGTNSTVVVDGSGTTAPPVGTNITVAMRLCRSANTTASLNGTIMEAGLWNSAFNSTVYGNVNTNQHGANGYNF